MNRTECLKQIQRYKFAAYDMLLYLDTHSDDKKAFELYKTLVKKARMLISEFEQNYGPLSADSVADFDTFRWLENPWPWEKEANA